MNTRDRIDGHGFDDARSDNAGSGDARLDALARSLHAQALQALSPRTRAQLLLRRGPKAGAPARPRAYAWPLATACALAALAIGWQLRDPAVPPAAPPAPLVAAAPDEDGATLALEENPELFEWLASGDAATLAME